MQEHKGPTSANSIFAILAGILATAFAALALYPLLSLALEHFFELNFSEEKKGGTANDILLNTSFLIYFSIAALFGGLVCSLICRTQEYAHTWFLLLIFLIIILLIGGRRENTINLITLALLASCTGITYFAGTKWGIRIKQRKKVKQEDI